LTTYTYYGLFVSVL